MSDLELKPFASAWAGLTPKQKKSLLKLLQAFMEQNSAARATEVGHPLIGTRLGRDQASLNFQDKSKPSKKFRGVPKASKSARLSNIDKEALYLAESTAEAMSHQAEVKQKLREDVAQLVGYFGDDRYTGTSYSEKDRGDIYSVNAGRFGSSRRH